MISAIRAMKVPNYHKVITVILITTTSIAAEFNPILSPLWFRLWFTVCLQCLWSPQTTLPLCSEKLRPRSCQLTQIQTGFLPAPLTAELHTCPQLLSGMLSGTPDELSFLDLFLSFIIVQESESTPVKLQARLKTLAEEVILHSVKSVSISKWRLFFTDFKKMTLQSNNASDF